MDEIKSVVRSRELREIAGKNEPLEMQLISSLVKYGSANARMPRTEKPRMCSRCKNGNHELCTGQIRAKHGLKLKCKCPKCGKAGA